MVFVFIFTFIALSIVAEYPESENNAHVVLEVHAPKICDKTESLQNRITTRLGYNPFTSDASDQKQTKIRVDVLPSKQSPASLDAHIVIKNLDGKLQQRDLHFDTNNCDAVFETLASALSITLFEPMNPGAHQEPRQKKESVQKREVIIQPAPFPKSQAAYAQTSTSSNLGMQGAGSLGRWQGGAGLAYIIGTVPKPTLSPRLFVGLDMNPVTISLEGRFDLPSAERFSTDIAIEVSLLAGGLIPCRRFGHFSACATLFGGIQRASSLGLESPKPISAPFVSMGLRAAWFWVVDTHFFIEPFLDVAAHLTRTTLRIGTLPAWNSDNAHAGIGLAGGFF